MPSRDDFNESNPDYSIGIDEHEDKNNANRFTFQWYFFDSEFKQDLQDAYSALSDENSLIDSILDAYYSYYAYKAHTASLSGNPDQEKLIIERLAMFYPPTKGIENSIAPEFSKVLFQEFGDLNGFFSASINVLFNLNSEIQSNLLSSSRSIEKALLKFSDLLYKKISRSNKPNLGESIQSARMRLISSCLEAEPRFNDENLNLHIDKTISRIDNYISTGRGRSYAYKLIREIPDYLVGTYKRRAELLRHLLLLRKTQSQARQRKIISLFNNNAFEKLALKTVRRYCESLKNSLNIMLLISKEEEEFKTKFKELKKVVNSIKSVHKEYGTPMKGERNYGRGCFCLADVDSSLWICFSGVDDTQNNVIKSTFKIARPRITPENMERIRKSLEKVLAEPVRLAKTTFEIRYYFANPRNYATIAQICMNPNSKLLETFCWHFKRMFSCCERKIFANLQHSNFKKIKLFIKYPPCPMCQRSIDNLRNIEIVGGGTNNESGLRMITFDSLLSSFLNETKKPSSP